MTITSRVELRDYVLRELGYPLIEIDITDEAMEDRIDEALAFFREYFYDGADRYYLKHVVTSADMTNGYITMPPEIWGVNGIMASGNGNLYAGDLYIFSPEYQWRQQDIQSLTNTSLIYYTQVMSHLALMDSTLTVQRQFRFNRNTDKLFIDMNWATRVTVGQVLLVDCWAAIDPVVNIKFWDNRHLKQYVTALFKRQWSRAYSKFRNITLPGGMTIDGQTMYQESVAEIKEIENDIINNQAPLGFSVG